MTNNNKSFNNVPSIVFTSFKTRKNLSVLFMTMSMLLSLWMLIKSFLGQISFSAEQLNDMAGFSLTFVFIVATLGFTIFSVIKTEEYSHKNEILFSYVGTSFLIASIAVFTYILSYCDFLNVKVFGEADIFSIYFCTMFPLICRCITSILATIIAYFNIKE